jgi:hypothetical protein
VHLGHAVVRALLRCVQRVSDAAEQLTWVLFHWQKGVPWGDVVDKQQGKFDRLTMWEQMDLGVQYTPARKFFTLVPIVLYAAERDRTLYIVSTHALSAASSSRRTMSSTAGPFCFGSTLACLRC